LEEPSSPKIYKKIRRIREAYCEKSSKYVRGKTGVFLEGSSEVKKTSPWSRSNREN